jgi:hypothetical protein
MSAALRAETVFYHATTLLLLAAVQRALQEQLMPCLT